MWCLRKRCRQTTACCLCVCVCADTIILHCSPLLSHIAVMHRSSLSRPVFGFPLPNGNTASSRHVLFSESCFCSCICAHQSSVFSSPSVFILARLPTKTSQNTSSYPLSPVSHVPLPRSPSHPRTLRRLSFKLTEQQECLSLLGISSLLCFTSNPSSLPSLYKSSSSSGQSSSLPPFLLCNSLYVRFSLLFCLHAPLFILPFIPL